MGVFKNGVGRPSNETIRKRNIFKGICLVLVLIVIILVAYIVNDKLKSNIDDNNTDKKNVSTKETNDGWYEPAGTAKELNLYKTIADYGTNIRMTEKEEYDALNNIKVEKLNAYKCDNEDCKLFSNYNYSERMVLIKDGDYVIYNFKTNKAKKLALGDYSDKVNYINDITGEYGEIGIFVNDAGKKTYFEFSIVADVDSYLLGLIDEESNIIVMLKDDEIKDENSWYSSDMSGAKYFDDGSVYYIEGNRYVKYDPETKKLEKSNYYHNMVLINEKGYIVVVDNDNYLKVLDKKGKELAKLTKINDDIVNLHPVLSGWYEQDKKAGIYVVVEDPRVTCDDLSKEIKGEAGCNSEYGSESLGYEYYYIPKTGETGKIATYIGGYAKPVLYLYPKKDNTKVTVSFAKSNLLTTTYPKYKNKWEVVANKNGDLYDLNNKYYYGLYWEESGSIKVDFNEGFYVTKENAIDFLEEKLSVIGLNDKERNEFIMYWLPILEKNGKNLVYFELTDSRESYNKLIINPKPDSLLRMAIHVKKVDKKTNIKEQKLTTFDRKGFTAVEWGGVIHK